MPKIGYSYHPWATTGLFRIQIQVSKPKNLLSGEDFASYTKRVRMLQILTLWSSELCARQAPARQSAVLGFANH